MAADAIPLRLGTRGSALARWQADWVTSCLQQRGIQVEQILITTQGDVSQQPLGAIGGQGLFTKEIQRALLAGEIDMAVHSLKDLPTDAVPGLELAAVPERESTRDVLVAGRFSGLQQLPSGARIGTGSSRRRSQLLHHRSDLDVQDIRGNLDTRLRKLDEQQYDAIVLAEAGLKRLGWQARVTEVLSREIMLPAVGQGALGIEIRADDQPTREKVQSLNDAPSWLAVQAERAMLATLRAGCLAPVGAWGRVDPAGLRLDAVVLSRDGSQRITAFLTGTSDDAPALGHRVAEQLLDSGAAALIRTIREEA